MDPLLQLRNINFEGINLLGESVELNCLLLLEQTFLFSVNFLFEPGMSHLPPAAEESSHFSPVHEVERVVFQSLPPPTAHLELYPGLESQSLQVNVLFVSEEFVHGPSCKVLLLFQIFSFNLLHLDSLLSFSQIFFSRSLVFSQSLLDLASVVTSHLFVLQH